MSDIKPGEVYIYLMVTIKRFKTREKRVHTCVKKGSIDYLNMHIAQVSDKIIRISLKSSKYYHNDHVHHEVLLTRLHLSIAYRSRFKKNWRTHAHILVTLPGYEIYITTTIIPQNS